METNRRFEAQGRYGYIGIDEYIGDKCLRTVLTGIKPQHLGRRIADLLNMAYEHGKKDAETK